MREILIAQISTGTGIDLTQIIGRGDNSTVQLLAFMKPGQTGANPDAGLRSHRWLLSALVGLPRSIARVSILLKESNHTRRWSCLLRRTFVAPSGAIP